MPRLTLLSCLALTGLLCGCPTSPTDPADAGPVDGGTIDAGIPDAGALDAGIPDAGSPDAGVEPDAGALDAGEPDAGPVDAGCPLGPDEGAACLTRADCGEPRDAVLTLACAPGEDGGICRDAAERDADCAPGSPGLIQLSVQRDHFIVAPIHSIFVRGYFAGQADGGVTTCDQLMALGALARFPDAGAAIDAEGALNLSTWGGFPIASTGQDSYLLNVTHVPAARVLFYVEAWGGPLDTGTRLPHGAHLGHGCVAEQEIGPAIQPPQVVTVPVAYWP